MTAEQQRDLAAMFMAACTLKYRAGLASTSQEMSGAESTAEGVLADTAVHRFLRLLYSVSLAD